MCDVSWLAACVRNVARTTHACVRAAGHSPLKQISRPAPPPLPPPQVCQWLLAHDYWMTGLELLVEAQEADREGDVAALASFFGDAARFPPEAVAACEPADGVPCVCAVCVPCVCVCAVCVCVCVSVCVPCVCVCVCVCVLCKWGRFGVCRVCLSMCVRVSGRAHAHLHASVHLNAASMHAFHAPGERACACSNSVTRM